MRGSVPPKPSSNLPSSEWNPAVSTRPPTTPSGRISMPTPSCPEAPPCTPVLLIVCKRKSPPLLHPPSRSRLLLPQKGNTPSGSEDPSCLPSPPSNRCGSPSKNTMSAAHPLSTGSASNFTTLLIYFCNCWHFNCLIDLFFIVIGFLLRLICFNDVLVCNMES